MWNRSLQNFVFNIGTIETIRNGKSTYSASKCQWSTAVVLVLHARIQSLKESPVVTIESFSIELKETIVHKCSKKKPGWETSVLKTVFETLWL